jgi:uncharacterized membrane protein YhhN
MTFYGLLGVALVIAVLDWVAVYQKNKFLELFLKPAVMIIILAAIGLAGGFSGAMAWFALGILFSLVGDILLLPSGAHLILGGAAFFVAFIMYIVGFNQVPPPLNLTSLVLILLVGLAAGQVYRKIWSQLGAKGGYPLVIMVLVYLISLSLMVISTLNTLIRIDWQAAPALIASAGGILFLLSDLLLLLNKFFTHTRNSAVWVMVAYHLGQILIITGAGLHYL